MKRSSLVFAALSFVLVAASPGAGAEPEKPEPAELAVSGLGWWRSREMRVSLERLLGEERGPTVSANAIEDAAFLLVSALGQQGYLKPKVVAKLTLVDGSEATYTFDEALTTMLPRPLEAKKLALAVEPGVRSVVGEVRIDGLEGTAGQVTRETAISYFRANDTPIVGDAARAFSPTRMRRGAESLEEDLRQRGFAEAAVEATVERSDEKTGETDLLVVVRPGVRWRVVVTDTAGAEAANVAVPTETLRKGEAWSPLWQQNVNEGIRQAFYARGYPEVRVRLETKPGEIVNDERQVAVTAVITPGPQVRLGEVRFEGNRHTREETLRRRVRTREGEWLNPLEVERSRYRLGRLGAFSAVDVRYEESADNAGERDVVFALRELPRWDASLLFGYGSYEQLRAGVELRQTNLLGRAHQSRLQFVQSLKSTRGEYTYTVPELFGETLDGSARLFALQRDEQAFEREEYGASVALKRRVPVLKAEGTVAYTFQSLKNADNRLNTRAVDENSVQVASVDLNLTRDERDNPLRPRRGYRWFAQLESASRRLGGEVDYQILEMGAAYHTSWGRGRWVHAGLTHGIITTFGADNDRGLPVNKRFFPGGDSSIRGYQEGEAAPRAEDGLFLGAKTYLLANFEVEQAITNQWAVVVFLDALGSSAVLANYPFDEELYSVGLGVRYQTVIGPVRLEYGHNLNPRTGDSAGTLHFSLGFPF